MFARIRLEPMQTVHATTVAIGGEGVMIRGPSGSGKSDLALRLIDEGAVLVADDRTGLSLEGERVVARPPEAIAGKLEVRGMGIVRLPILEAAPLALVVELVKPADCERMPQPSTAEVLGRAVPCVRLAPFEASATAKVRLRLRVGADALEA